MEPRRDRRPFGLILEAAGIVGFILLAIYFLAISWRRWPDPIVDFGRELYLPWRLAQGAVLYRDVDDFYGPLSQYLNAALFKCFGPGLMVLVAANLVIFAGIATLLYSLFRRAWGIGAALAAVALFVSIFAFSQFGWCGNFNYAAPYSHETTHGFLVCLLLIAALLRWIEKGTLAESFLAGILFGLTLVLKPEAMLAGGLLVAAAVVWKFRFYRRPAPSAFGALALGTILPTLLFFVYFACFLPWPEAASAACCGWLNALNGRFSDTLQQATYFGSDQPWTRLGHEGLATLCAALLITLIATSAWMVERITDRGIAIVFTAFLLVILVALGIDEINWMESGRCLPGLLILYVASRFIWRKSPGERRAQTARILITIAAAAFLGRMLLNARLYHFGYYQAALAAMMVPAILIGEFAPQFGFGRKGAAVIVLGTLALLVPGVVRLASVSHQWLAMKTVPVGNGRDLFYAPNTQFQPTRGDLVNEAVRTLRLSAGGQTLVVLPEGAMINYLARMPSTVAPVYFFGFATSHGHEKEIVDALKRHPPDWIVIISRDLREFGVQRYGESPGEGMEILEWVAQNYESSAAFGGDVFDVNDRGAVILQRKAAATSGN